jgi:creatinine amidohydrolase
MQRTKIIPVLFLSMFPPCLAVPVASAQQAAGHRVKWEELTAPDFVQAVEESGATCLLPFGVVEKHGSHLPLGTDVLNVRNLALLAAQKEYAVVFPEYYFGQIFEAKHQPGTVAYSEKLMWELLQETCDEIARNGFRKILIVNGHGGNGNFLPFFCQSQLASRKDYAVFLFQPPNELEASQEVRKMRKTPLDMHAGEVETSMMLANRPELVRLDQANAQSGEDLQRLSGLHYVYTAIWWYARFPNHYAGDARPASRELGELVLSQRVDQLARGIREVKADAAALELQKRFFDESEKPLKTRQ